jgi:hypothetical protein
MFHRKLMSDLKAMGRTQQWMRYMVGKGYDESETIGDYKVQYDEDDGDIRVLIWNPTSPCMVMAIDKSDKTAALNVIRYDSKCTTDGRMKRGDGTRKMIQFGLRLLEKKGATHVSLMDNSTIDCNGQTVDLAAMYFLKYGMTWYEKYFGFKPAERFHRSYETAKRMRESRLDIEQLKEQPCDFFTDDVVQDLFRHIGLTDFYRYEWTLRLHK